MSKHLVHVCAVLSMFSLPAVAQRWEIGGAAGGGFYTSQDVKTSVASASAKIANGIFASGWVANNNGNFWGGEFRYDYQRGDLDLSSNGTKASFASQSHAVHYDVLLHFAGIESPVRPFVAFGGGVKRFEGIGTEVAAQPLNGIALLTKTGDLRPLVSVGAGLKINARRLGFRIEAHDFLTPFPKKVIAPAEGASVGGWLQDFVVSAGISILF